MCKTRVKVFMERVYYDDDIAKTINEFITTPYNDVAKVNSIDIDIYYDDVDTPCIVASISYELTDDTGTGHMSKTRVASFDVAPYADDSIKQINDFIANPLNKVTKVNSFVIRNFSDDDMFQYFRAYLSYELGE